jgi:hypothetical protein
MQKILNRDQQDQHEYMWAESNIFCMVI